MEKLTKEDVDKLIWAVEARLDDYNEKDLPPLAVLMETVRTAPKEELIRWLTIGHLIELGVQAGVGK